MKTFFKKFLLYILVVVIHKYHFIIAYFYSKDYHKLLDKLWRQTCKWSETIASKIIIYLHYRIIGGAGGGD